MAVSFGEEAVRLRIADALGMAHRDDNDPDQSRWSPEAPKDDA